ncbi:hypothetical protein CSHISOI_00353 [Colletotrichum shisoi]|uniref:Uncharacterized protein n=1 Tax=Colletotrichum shisoi TaxID=2078593 RepID=A0A5Q4CB47_9PEZI|nr:hypothetical protein CSHISOI_00353 [Colletotrichum shisoi]
MRERTSWDRGPQAVITPWCRGVSVFVCVCVSELGVVSMALIRPARNAHADIGLQQKQNHPESAEFSTTHACTKSCWRLPESLSSRRDIGVPPKQLARSMGGSAASQGGAPLLVPSRVLARVGNQSATESGKEKRDTEQNVSRVGSPKRKAWLSQRRMPKVPLGTRPNRDMGRDANNMRYETTRAASFTLLRRPIGNRRNQCLHQFPFFFLPLLVNFL